MKSVILGLLVILFVSGAAYGDADELFRQGSLLFQSEPEKAFPLFVQAAEEGNVSAMVGAGYCLENGVGTKTDYAQAIEWYEKGVALNNLKACEGLARIYASCPDPQFHDGEKAVKYAAVVARKKPKDSDALALLAAAHARNMDFDQAVQIAGKAADYELRAEEGSMLRAWKENYRRGMPYPDIATRSWLREASGKQSLWAVEQMLAWMSDRFDPQFNPEEAMRLCKIGVDAGESSFYLTMGKLYLHLEELEKAEKCFNEVYENWIAGNRKQALPVEAKLRGYFKMDAEKTVKKAKSLKTWQVEYVVEGISVDPTLNGDDRETRIYKTYASLDELKEDYPFVDENRQQYYNGGADSETVYHQLEISKEWTPPNMAGVEFLLKIAAGKGSPEAGEMLAEMDAKLKQSRAILNNKDGRDNATWASALSAEAVKYCNNDVFPVSLRLAALYLEKSYSLDPAARTACMLGGFYLRDHLFLADYNSRPVDLALTWLERAHAAGYSPATRRLIQLYACDRDPEVCKGEIAVQYASAYVESCTSDDDEAKWLLACAYARNNQFREAVEIMTEVMHDMPETKGELYYKYRRDLKQFNQNDPCTISFYAHARNRDPLLFADWAQTLD